MKQELEKEKIFTIWEFLFFQGILGIFYGVLITLFYQLEYLGFGLFLGGLLLSMISLWFRR